MSERAKLIHRQRRRDESDDAMKRYSDVTWTFLLALCVTLLHFSPASSSEISARVAEKWHARRDTPMDMVLMTQKGYIQFLRWELPVPDIHEFTFCLWIRSNNFTYPHSIFSYSRNERERLISAWISAEGRTAHLEIAGMEVFRSEINVKEHEWYHVCQSWENEAGRYALWINGNLKSQGYSEETRGHVIPKNGDLVLGQEYTDFDKGLEEGIEGSVLGFNLILASAFEPLDSADKEETFPPTALRSRNSVRSPVISFFARMPIEITNVDREYLSHRNIYTAGNFAVSKRLVASNGDRFIRNLVNNNSDSGIARSSTTKVVVQPVNRIAAMRYTEELRKRKATRSANSNWKLRDGGPLGMRLIKLSYVHCQLGRGSPPIGGSLMLISWSRTPVRVFGGATIKSAKGICGDF